MEIVEGGATSVTLTKTLLKNTNVDDIIMVAGGSGGSSKYQNDGFYEVQSGGGGINGISASVDGGHTSIGGQGTQTGGYRLGEGECGTQGGAGGGGFYGGYSSPYNTAFGSGGSGYVNEDLLESDAYTTRGDYYGNGKCKITYIGKIKTTLRLNAGIGGKINGQDYIEIQGEKGWTITLNNPTKISEFEFNGWKQLSGDGQLNDDNTFTFNRTYTVLQGKWKGGEFKFEANLKNTNEVGLKLVGTTIDESAEYIMERSYDKSTWRMVGLDGEDLGEQVDIQEVTFSGSTSKTYYQVLQTGIYRFELHGAGGGEDYNGTGGTGATITVECKLKRGENLEVWAALYRWPFGGMSDSSGSGGGASYIKLNNQYIVVAAGGGGASQAACGYGGRISTNNWGNTGSMDGAYRFRFDHSYHTNLPDWPANGDGGGGGGGWYGGFAGFDFQYGGNGGRNGYQNLFDGRIVTLINERAGVDGGGGSAGYVKIKPVEIIPVIEDINSVITTPLMDKASPDIPNETYVLRYTPNSVQIKLQKVNDNGTDNYFRARKLSDDSSIENISNIEQFTYTSGLDHWKYAVVASPSTTPTSWRTTNNDTLELDDATYNAKGKYLKVVAVDKSGNESNEYVLHILGTLTLTYDKNNTTKNIYNDECTTTATGTMDKQEVIEGSTVGVRDNQYSKTGYIFKEWNTKSDASGTGYQPGDTISYTDLGGLDTTLYAIWEPITYKIRFNGNNNFNTSQGSYIQEDIRFDHWTNLMDNKFNRNTPYTWGTLELKDKYKFIGWGTTSNKYIPDYANKQSIRNLRTEQDAIYDLYALWQKDITLTFNLNGGTLNGDSSDIKLQGTIYNSQKVYSFNINNGITVANLPYCTEQIGKIQAFGATGSDGKTYDKDGINNSYRKVDSSGNIYRLLGWSTKADATEPDTGLDMYGSSKLNIYTIKDNTILYAVWEPVLLVNISLDRGYGNITFTDGSIPQTTLKNIAATTVNPQVQTIIRPGEQGSYELWIQGKNTNITVVEFDNRITDIYNHNGVWTDSLNPAGHGEETETGQKHGLNRTLNNKNYISRKFYIPQYLGTNQSYDTSNPSKTSIPVHKYYVMFKVQQSSKYYQEVYGKDEEIYITGTIYITNDNTSTGDEPIESVLDELRTRIKTRIVY